MFWTTSECSASWQRIAHQLHEENHEEKGIVLVGIAPRGLHLAKRFSDRLKEISDLKVDLVNCSWTRTSRLEAPVKLSLEPETLRDRRWCWWMMC